MRGLLFVTIMPSLAFLMLSMASAQELLVGVTPPRIYAGHLLKGSDFRGDVTLSKSPEQALEINTETSGMAGSWITVGHKAGFVLPTGERQVILNFTIHVPEDASPGNYTGRINIMARTNVTPGKGTEIVLPVNIFINVTDMEFDDFSVRSARIMPEDNLVRLILDADNRGNIVDGPGAVWLIVMDSHKKRILSVSNFDDISGIGPFTRKKLSFDMKNDLAPGQYWAWVIACSDKCSRCSDDACTLADEYVAFDISGTSDDPGTNASSREMTNGQADSNTLTAENASLFIAGVGAIILLFIFLRRGDAL